MNYLIYKITNLINKKIYIGAHITLNTNDSYFGSGYLLKRAIAKYGKQNFKKDILFSFDNEEDMWNKEKELVNLEFLGRPDVYNICLGGKGGNLMPQRNLGYDICAKNEDGETVYITKKEYKKNKNKYFIKSPFKQKHVYMIHSITKELKQFPCELKVEIEKLGWEHNTKKHCRYIDKNENAYFLKNDDPLIDKLNLKTWSTGKSVVKIDDKIFWVNKEDITEDMISISKNIVSVKDENGKTKRVSIDDPEYISGKLVGVNKGKQGLFSHINETKIKCIYCNLETTPGNIKRWHNENCKSKKSF